MPLRKERSMRRGLYPFPCAGRELFHIGSKMTLERGAAPLRQSRRTGSLPRLTAVILAHAQLRQLILTERLKPGEWLRQEDLAGQLHISRTPIREALRLLGEEGLIEIA